MKTLGCLLLGIGLIAIFAIAPWLWWILLIILGIGLFMGSDL